MRLGTETASLVNHLHSRSTKGAPEPAAGMGATILMWTDRKAATVERTWVAGKYRYVIVREDRATRTDQNGMSDSQSYEYAPDPHGPTRIYRQELEGGRWRHVVDRKGRYVLSDGPGLAVGFRDHHHDVSF